MCRWEEEREIESHGQAGGVFYSRRALGPGAFSYQIIEAPPSWFFLHDKNKVSTEVRGLSH